MHAGVLERNLNYPLFFFHPLPLTQQSYVYPITVPACYLLPTNITTHSAHIVLHIFVASTLLSRSTFLASHYKKGSGGAMCMKYTHYCLFFTCFLHIYFLWNSSSKELYIYFRKKKSISFPPIFPNSYNLIYSTIQCACTEGKTDGANQNLLFFILKANVKIYI